MSSATAGHTYWRMNDMYYCRTHIQFTPVSFCKTHKYKMDLYRQLRLQIRIEEHQMKQTNLLFCTYLRSFSSLEASFLCFLMSSESLSASAKSDTALSRSFLRRSQSVRMLSLSSTILSLSLNAQSLLLFDTSASWVASVNRILHTCVSLTFYSS